MLKENDRISGGNIFEGIVSVRTLIANSLAFAAGISGNDRKIKRVFCDSGRTGKSREYAWIKHRGEELGFDVVMCSSEDIDCMTVGNTHGGLAAECTGRTIPGISADMIKPNGFYVMLEGIEDPYNFGYALRSLYAAGADGIILSERNWMTAAGIVCRASAGASELIPLYLCGNDPAGVMKTAGYRVVCADLRDSVPVFDADLSLPLFLVVGGEKRGISRRLLDSSDLNVRIDYARDFTASLSAASAATVAGYEVFRQNRVR